MDGRARLGYLSSGPRVSSCTPLIYYSIGQYSELGDSENFGGKYVIAVFVYKFLIYQPNRIEF